MCQTIVIQGKPFKGGLQKDPDVFQWVPVDYAAWREQAAEAARATSAPEAEGGADAEHPPPPSAPSKGGDATTTSAPPSAKAVDAVDKAKAVVEPFAS
jgi:hypothetical protein